MSEEKESKFKKVESAASIGSVVLSVVLVALQIVGLFRGRPIKKI